jgi:hypothetical protein
LPWFGGWRWRDADSVFYIPFDAGTPLQIMAYYHIAEHIDRTLTDPAVTPFAIANGDWDVAIDGQRIVFQSALDGNMSLLEVVEQS